MNQMTLRLSISMQKGGVGKTTTVFNLAGALANRGHDVLVVDVDPQGALTFKLGFQEQYLEGEYALYDVLLDHGELEMDELDELILEHEEVDLVPSHIRDFRLEKELIMTTRTEERLRSALDRSNVDEKYDYIILDSPPNLGPLADGSILATEHVLFPSHPNDISQHSLKLLFDEIDTLEDVFDDYEITTVASVLNEVEGDSVSESKRNWFVDTFGEENVYTIPRLKTIEHAIGYRTSVFEYDPEDAGYPWDERKLPEIREAYDQIADHVEEYA